MASSKSTLIFSHYRQRPSSLFIPPTALFLLLLMCHAPSRVRADCYNCNDTRSKSPIQSTSFTDGSPPNSDYSNNLDCCWLIQPGYSGIELSFSRFQTERGYDTVRIYDGPSTSSALIATVSGSSIPDSVSTNGGSLLVRFTTDGSVVDRGFAASYQRHYGEVTSTSSSPNCAATALFDSSGFVSISDEDPYFPPNRDAVVCSLIQPGYSSIRLDSNYFSFPGHDVLSFYSSSTIRNSDFIGTVTYNDTRRPGAQGDRVVIRSPTNNLLIATRLSYYSSDLSYYWSTLIPAIERSYSRATGTGCTSRTTLTADSGSFTDGSAADDLYPSFLSCSWLIAPSGDRRVRLTFQNLDTEPINDEVRVYDGSETSSPLIGAFSGSSLPTDTITSTGSSLIVTFVTNGLGSGRGFSVSYSSWIANIGMDGIVTLHGMPGMVDVPEHQSAFREAIARVGGEEVYSEQVEIVSVEDCSPESRWWEGCVEVMFRVTGIATGTATAEAVADGVREAAELSANNENSLAAVLGDLSGVTFVTVTDVRINESGSPLTLALILGVTLGAVSVFGAVVLFFYWKRSAHGNQNRIFSVQDANPAETVPALAVDSPQVPASASPDDTPVDQEESGSRSQTSQFLNG